jgi:hypothetical protein
LSIRRYEDLRIDPTDDYQSLDNVTSLESITCISTTDRSSQCSEGSGTDKEKDECDSDRNNMSEKTECDMVAHEEESR